MRIYLLWHRNTAPVTPDAAQAVGERLRRLATPFLAETPAVRVRSTPHAALAWIELPVERWHTPFFEEDDQTWAFAAEYPVEAASRRSGEETSASGPALPRFCRRLQADPTPILRNVAPPFLLIWGCKRTGAVHVHNDGLGAAHALESDVAAGYALTNKAFALRALGLPLVPDPLDWAVRLVLDWFPRQRTGFQGVRYLAPGAQVTLEPDRVRLTRTDVLSSWVHPSPMDRTEALECARAALVRQVRALTPHCDYPSVGLSGGFDSRAVVAAMLEAEIPFRARVRGLPDRPDVVVARELAEIAGFPLKISGSRSLPPTEPEAIRAAVDRALLWQSGGMVTHKHKSFRKTLGGGVVNVMGQHGEIGRGHYRVRLRHALLDTGIDTALDQLADLDATWVETRITNAPACLRASWREPVRAVLHAVLAQADAFGFTGAHRLDFLYLFERTRRWATASLASQTGFVFAPFLTPDYIRAVYARLDDDLTLNPFHRYIVERCFPPWAEVPYVVEERPTAPGPQVVAGETDWKRSVGNAQYDQLAYWYAVGREVVEEALAAPGLLAEIADVDQTRAAWRAGRLGPKAPDAVVMLSRISALF